MNYSRVRGKRTVIPSNLLTALFLFLLPLPVGARDLEIHFINLGLGDCALVRTPSGQNILIDSGLWIMGFKLERYLRKQGVKVIDLLVITHPDLDHFSGAKWVVRDFRVKEFV